MLLQQPNTNDNQCNRPESGNPMQIEHIQISEQIQTSDDHESDPAPKLSILHAAELLLQPVNGRLQHDSLRTQHPFLRCVISLERHVEIKRRGRQSEECSISSIR